MPFDLKFTPFWLIYLVWATLFLESAVSLSRGEWSTAFIAFVTFVLTLLPLALERRFALSLPRSFLAAIIIFISATLFLGEVGGFYERFWWWDLLLHAGSALGFGIIGFVIMLYLAQSSKLQASPALITVFSFSFAVAIGVMWEIFEFVMDQLFGLNMQKSGLRDTMSDLIVDAGGAFLASLSGYIYLRFGPRELGSRLIHQFCRENMPYFRKKLMILRRGRQGRADEAPQ